MALRTAPSRDRGPPPFTPSLYILRRKAHPKKSTQNKNVHLLGSIFGRTDFLRIFIFGPPDFFADFVAGFFLLTFVGKKCPEKSSRKIPGKMLENLYNKNPPTHFCRLARATSEQVFLKLVSQGKRQKFAQTF